MTEACCRAVKDAISSSCLCGLVEILDVDSLDEIDVEIVAACPAPERVDAGKVEAMVPIGRKSVRIVSGGMQAPGLCVPRFAPQCDQIVVANAAVTVSVEEAI